MTHHQRPAKEGVDLGCEGQQWMSLLCVFIGLNQAHSPKEESGTSQLSLPGIGRVAAQLSMILPCLVPASDKQGWAP